jgi:hypothetical protein
MDNLKIKWIFLSVKTYLNQVNTNQTKNELTRSSLKQERV